MKCPPEESVPVISKYEGIESLNIEPEEAFVFSRINGTSSLKEIAQILGYDVARVWRLLLRLVEAGFVSVEAEKKSFNVSKEKKPPKNILVSSPEEASSVDVSKISQTLQNEIELRFHRLEKQNYFEILDVRPSATQEEIRKNYFSLVKQFHPDRFFGKELGEYQTRLETLFKQMTLAFEVLTHPKRRKEYEKFLQESSSPSSFPKKPPSLKPEVEANAKRYFEMGQKAEKEKKFFSAANFFQMAVDLVPTQEEYEVAWKRMKPHVDRKKSEPIFLEAMKALKEGSKDVAQEKFEEVLRLNPRNKESYRELAFIYARQRDQLTKAKEMAQTAIEFFPDDPKIHSILGYIYKELGEKEQALREVKISLRLDGEGEYANRLWEQLMEEDQK